jgi:hypothetical protein
MISTVKVRFGGVMSEMLWKVEVLVFEFTKNIEVGVVVRSRAS